MTTHPEISDPTQCSGEEGFCPQHGFQRQALKQRPGDQPLPEGGVQCVQDALIQEIEHRKRLGVDRYGSALMTHNGRNALRDAREEAVDLAVYLMQVELEDQDRQKELADLRAEVAAARKYAADMREFASPHGVAKDYADDLIAAMDRAKASPPVPVHRVSDEVLDGIVDQMGGGGR